MKRFGWEGALSTLESKRRSITTRRERSGGLVSVHAALTRSLEAARSAGWSGARLRDFEDFVAGEPVRAGLSQPDAGFRERLRRRLWRVQVATRSNRLHPLRH
jgi:hypothetical protein